MAAQNARSWSEPFPPHRIAGNLYYVGTRGLASYLITTPEGHILINSSLESSVPMIEASIKKLGFRFADVKILLVSHAHWDHNAGSALVKERTGAKYMVMEPDVRGNRGRRQIRFLLRQVAGVTVSAGEGGPRSSRWRPSEAWRSRPDRPSHTWTHERLHDMDHEGKRGRQDLQRRDRGQPQCKRRIPAREQREVPADRRGLCSGLFEVLRSLHCDIFLGAHGDYYGLEAQVPPLRGGGAERLHRPGRISRLRGRKREGLPQGMGAAEEVTQRVCRHPPFLDCALALNSLSEKQP